jgi:hypothetical protein
VDNENRGNETLPCSPPRKTDSALPPSEITVDSPPIESALALTVTGTTNLTSVSQLQVKLYDTIAMSPVAISLLPPSLSAGIFSLPIDRSSLAPSTYIVKVFYVSTTDPAGDVSDPFVYPTE